MIDCLIDRLTDNWTFAVSFTGTSSGRDSEDVDRRFPFQTLRSGVTRALGAGGNSNEVRQPQTRIFLGGRRTHGALKQNAAQQNNFCVNNPATKTAEVCCNGPLFTHSANFERPYFVLVCHKNIFGGAVLRPLACCALGQLPPRFPRLCVRGSPSFPFLLFPLSLSPGETCWLLPLKLRTKQLGQRPFT